MILYLDTSALVKLYISENHSADILMVVKKTNIVASHVIAYVEAQATFSRLKREKKLTNKSYDIVKNSFIQDWKNYLQIENTPTLLQHAADLAEAFGLRAYDSIHLATADTLRKESNQPVTFACFDRHLNKAAHVLGLILFP